MQARARLSFAPLAVQGSRMRRLSLALSFLASLAASPAVAQQPPHAWLFGTWTGGMFSAPANVPAEACLGQPVVIFTRDVVMRATLSDQAYVQRLISSAQTRPGVTEFRFTPAPRPVGAGVLGIPAGPQFIGFGCSSPDWLPVKRISNDVIEFPGCADFPFPLRRCTSK